MDHTVFVIDACSLIEASKRYYLNKKTFESIWEKFAEMFENGTLISSSEILDEIQDDDLKEWLKDFNYAFKPLTKEIQEKVIDILNTHPEIINLKKNKKSNSNGDPFLIATAMCEYGEIKVVTEEKNTREFGIPKIALSYGIKSITLDEFLAKILE